MRQRCVILLSILLMFSFTGSAYPGVTTLHFDSDGNLTSADRRKSLLPLSHSSGTSRYSIPEGVELMKDIRYEYYPVFGKTFANIVKSAEENGPFDRNKKRRFPSTYEWNLSLSYQIEYEHELEEETQKVHAAIEVYDVKITNAITITLPTLIDDTALNPIEKNLWKNYFSRILEHEHDHVRIIRDDNSKNAFLDSLSELYLIFDSAGGIDIDRKVSLYVREETAKLAREWIKKLKERLEDYDRITGHGAKQEQRGTFFKQTPSEIPAGH